MASGWCISQAESGQSNTVSAWRLEFKVFSVRGISERIEHVTIVIISKRCGTLR